MKQVLSALTEFREDCYGSGGLHAYNAHVWFQWAPSCPKCDTGIPNMYRIDRYCKVTIVWSTIIFP